MSRKKGQKYKSFYCVCIPMGQPSAGAEKPPLEGANAQVLLPLALGVMLIITSICYTVSHCNESTTFYLSPLPVMETQAACLLGLLGNLPKHMLGFYGLLNSLHLISVSYTVE